MFTDRFFFFQAEDGIRDVAVTGVQTCALPIYRIRFDVEGHLGEEHSRVRQRTESHLKRPFVARGQQAPSLAGASLPKTRSEERRVGKECRSRWSPYH